ncbi:OmpA/MotB family protein [Lignipirellula cremea]|uniref:Peptidoglycan-binding protein ArfA n=1 Tax=Lignipirellula cremea TaxID=2528010 RepID=A0A518DSM1_9BACT|nr:OmpA family protein [Lignipirellula cremea]QDU94841.1 Peptidoglycan-binding protein ArfA [Lignipirellula cremea]
MRFSALIIILTLVATGCNQGPFGNSQNAAALQQQQQQQVAVATQLQARAEQLDANNRDLHTQLAQSQQQTQVMRDEMLLLQERLASTASQLQQTQVAMQQADKRIAGMQASTQRSGGAIITANNSLRQSVQAVDVPGLDVRLDNDVVRIAIPADELFAPGSFTLTQSANTVLDSAAAAIKQHYARQIIAIEAHTDNSTPSPASSVSSNHQLSASQAILIFDQLTRRNQLPAQQFFTVAQGGNHPLASNATPAGAAKNRRIELVVYPEIIGER